MTKRKDWRGTADMFRERKKLRNVTFGMTNLDDTVRKACINRYCFKLELIRKLFEKTGCLPNTDIDQATRPEFTFVRFR